MGSTVNQPTHPVHLAIVRYQQKLGSNQAQYTKLCRGCAVRTSRLTHASFKGAMMNSWRKNSLMCLDSCRLCAVLSMIRVVRREIFVMHRAGNLVACTELVNVTANCFNLTLLVNCALKIVEYNNLCYILYANITDWISPYNCAKLLFV